MKIRIAFMGRGYHQADSLPAELTFHEPARVADALGQLQTRLGDSERLPASCLLTVAGEHLGTISSYRDRPLRDGDELVLIAPVAGG